MLQVHVYLDSDDILRRDGNWGSFYRLRLCSISSLEIVGHKVWAFQDSIIDKVPYVLPTNSDVNMRCHRQYLDFKMINSSHWDGLSVVVNSIASMHISGVLYCISTSD